MKQISNRWVISKYGAVKRQGDRTKSAPQFLSAWQQTVRVLNTRLKSHHKINNIIICTANLKQTSSSCNNSYLYRFKACLFAQLK